MSSYIISLNPTNSLWPVTVTENVVQVDVLQAFVSGGGGGGSISDGDKGDITVSNSGAVWTIDPRAVTASKLFAISAFKMVGRHTSGSGDVQEVGLDGGLEYHGANIRREALTGDVTASAGSNTTTIANNAVSNTKLADMPANTFKGNNTGSSADPLDLTVAQMQAALGIGASTAITRRVDASECIPRTANGAGISVIETTTNAVNVDVLDFDAATSESANVWPEVPRGVTITGITITPRWTADSGSGGVVLAFSALWLQNDDAIDQAMGTAQTSTDTLIAAGDWHIGPTTATITPAGSWAADADLCIVVSRDTANGSDTLGVDLRLASFEITYLT
jgi:hypothetical protein